MAPQELLMQLGLSALLGAMGQQRGVVVGLKKAREFASEVDVWKGGTSWN